MHVIIMAIGDDRPGLTQSLADIILDSGGNWLESHFATLGGQYVGSVLVALPEDMLGGLQDAAAALRGSGFTATVQPVTGEEDREGTPLEFELVAQDRPGIVRELSAALAALGVSIDDLETATGDGAMFGGTMFRATASVRVPLSVRFDQVRSALETLSGEVMVDFTTVPAD